MHLQQNQTHGLITVCTCAIGSFTTILFVGLCVGGSKRKSVLYMP